MNRGERSAGGAGLPAYRGPVLTGLGLLTGVAVLAIGMGLLRRVDGVLGVVGASLFLVCGMVVVGSAVVVLVPAWWRRFPPAREETLDGEPADFHPRRTGVPTAWAFCTLVLLGGWCAALGVVGFVEDGLAWPVIAAAPTIYFLGFVVLRVLGRFRAAGTWLTPTRLVDEYYGLRSEIATADLLAMRATPEALWVVPGAGRDGAPPVADSQALAAQDPAGRFPGHRHRSPGRRQRGLGGCPAAVLRRAVRARGPRTGRSGCLVSRFEVKRLRQHDPGHGTGTGSQLCRITSSRRSAAGRR